VREPRALRAVDAAAASLASRQISAEVSLCSAALSRRVGTLPHRSIQRVLASTCRRTEPSDGTSVTASVASCLTHHRTSRASLGEVRTHAVVVDTAISAIKTLRTKFELNEHKRRTPLATVSHCLSTVC